MVKNYFPDVTLIIFQIVNVLISFIVITILFGVILRFYPMQIAWKDVRSGAFFTACLFMLGRFLIEFISITAEPFSLWRCWIVDYNPSLVYYTAAILYVGAEFTKVYAEYVGARIEPADYAVYVEQFEKEKRRCNSPRNSKTKCRSYCKR